MTDGFLSPPANICSPEERGAGEGVPWRRSRDPAMWGVQARGRGHGPAPQDRAAVNVAHTCMMFQTGPSVRMLGSGRAHAVIVPRASATGLSAAMWDEPAAGGSGWGTRKHVHRAHEGRLGRLPRHCPQPAAPSGREPGEGREEAVGKAGWTGSRPAPWKAAGLSLPLRVKTH